MAERIAPQVRACQSTGPLASSRSLNLNSPAPAMVGMESRKEKRAEASRLNPIISPAVMVMPEREVPGISASAWATPMNSTSFQVRPCSSRARRPRRSAYHSNSPNRMVVVAITNAERRSFSI